MSVNSFKDTAYNWWRATAYGAWTLFAVVGVASFVIAMAVIALTSAGVLTEESLLQPEWTLGIFAVQYTVGLLALLLVPVVFQKKTKEQLKKLFGVVRSPKFKDVGMALLAFVPYLLVSTVIVQIVTMLVSGFDVEQTQDVGFGDVSGVWQLVIAAIALVVLAPIAEELIFRGYLFGSVRGFLGFWPSALITSALFGLVHGQWNVGLDTFVLSIALCYLRERTGSVWAGVALHALKNALAFTLLFIFPVG